MSGFKPTRGQGIMGKVGAAAVIATLAGIPSLATAKPKPKPPAPPPPPPPVVAPQPAALNADPNTRWFADWHENTAPGPVDFFPTPGNLLGVPFMQTQLNGSAAAGKPLGIKVETPLSLMQGQQLFNTKYQPGDKAISYVFADFEQGTQAAVGSNVQALVTQVRMSQWSRNAYVGQWNLSPLDPQDDMFRREAFGGPKGKGKGNNGNNGNNGNGNGNNGGDDDDDGNNNGGGGNPGSDIHNWGKKEYDKYKVNMANPHLYPGGADFRNRSTNDWLNKNIRTGLFIAPIGRETLVQNVLDKSYNGKTLATGVNNHKQIPWVARFNNYGNSSLNNDPGGGFTYKFTPGKAIPSAGLSSTDTQDQMLGRGDFSAQIRHYRMRGAYSVNLFEPGVVGYTQQQMQQDVRDGWSNDARLNMIFAQGDNKYATMTLNPTIDGTTNDDRAEETGTIWSGQYSENVPNSNSKNGKGDLMVLASNLDSVNHLINFGSGDTPYDIFTKAYANGWTYDGKGTTESRNFLIEAGMHRMLQFDLVERRVYDSLSDLNKGNKKYKTQTVWMLNQSYAVFGNNNGRNEMGIPEPTTFGSLAAAGAIAVVCRRQRRKVS